MRDFSISFRNPNLWLVLLLIAVATLMYVVFYKKKGDSQKKARNILIVLRSFVFIFILFLLLKPEVQWSTVKHLSPVILVWIDNSLSMSAHKDFSPDSLRLSIEKIASSLSKDGVKVFYELFSRGVDDATTQLQDLTFGETATDISNLLNKSLSRHSGENIRAAVLVSDGVITQGEDPCLMNLDLPFPVFTVGVGDSVPMMDPSVSQLILPQSARVGDSVKIQAEIVPLGNGELLEVNLKENGHVIQKRLVETHSEFFYKDVFFYVVPERSGISRYEVEIGKVKDINPYNNIRAGLLRISSAKENIVILSAQPNFELRFLRMSIEEMEKFNVLNLIETSSQWIPTTLSSAMKERWDVTVFHGFPSSKTEHSQLEAIKQKIESDSSPVLVIYNRTLSLDKLHNIFNERLVDWKISDKKNETVLVQITQKGENHPITRDLEWRLGNEDVWGSLPPIAWDFENVKLANMFIPLVSTYNLSEFPVIAVRNRSGKRMVVLLGLDFWRWSFMTHDIGATSIYRETFTGIINWLSDTLSTSAIQIGLNKRVFLSGEVAEVIGHVFDVRGNIIPTAIVEGAVISEEGDKLPFSIQWDGKRYKGEIPLRFMGDYKIRIEAYLGSKSLGSTEQELTVMNQPIELSNIVQNTEVLRSIANRTGGEKININDLAGIGKYFSIGEKEKEQRHGIKLWQWYGSIIILVCFLCLEWVIRRVCGYH